MQLDLQQSGVLPDATPEGVQRVKDASTGLALVPFRRTAGYWTVKNGTATNEYREEGDLYGGGYPVQFIQTVAGIGNSVEMGFKFPGTRFGIACVRNMPTNAPFACFIDGEAYYVPTATPRGIDGSTAGPIHPIHLLIADNLPDRTDHECRILCNGNPTTSPTWLFLGALLESRFGYVTPPVAPRALEPVTLTTSAVSFPHDNGGAGAGFAMRLFRKVDYYNFHASATAVVTITRNSVVIWRASIAAGGMATFDPGTLTAYNETVTGSVAGGYPYQHLSDTATAVRATLYGTY